VTPRAIARAVITAGWLAGITLILAGLPLWAALTVPAATTVAAVTFPRWGSRPQAWLTAAVKRRIRRHTQTGGVLERA
jgi:hypothetical protein